MAKKATKKKPATTHAKKSADLPERSWKARCAACGWSVMSFESHRAAHALVEHCRDEHEDDSMNGTVGLVTL